MCCCLSVYLCAPNNNFVACLEIFTIKQSLTRQKSHSHLGKGKFSTEKSCHQNKRWIVRTDEEMIRAWLAALYWFVEFFESESQIDDDAAGGGNNEDLDDVGYDDNEKDDNDCVIGGDSHSMLVQSYLLRFFLLRQTMRTCLTSQRWWEWQQWWCWWRFRFWWKYFFSELRNCTFE